MSTITCAISKLPILEGEKVICLPLIFNSTYECEKDKGRIETKGMMSYTTHAFKLLGLAVRGTAGRDEVFHTIEKDGNTESMESYFEMSIESILKSLIDKEDVQHSKLDKGIVIFVKSAIFDYLAQPVADSFFSRNSVGEMYDELIEGIKKWNATKQEKSSDEEFNRFLEWDMENPFSYSAEDDFSLYRKAREPFFNFRNIYKKGLSDNTIRESVIDTFNFITNSYNIGYYFLPTLKGQGNISMHQAILDASKDILDEKIRYYNEDEEEWD